MSKFVNIHFSQGTLIIEGNSELTSAISQLIKYDERVKQYRAPAYHYSQIILTLRKENISHNDYAKAFSPVNINLNTVLTPRKHQTTALNKWKQNQYKGVVIMPTGSGKSFFAFMAINYLKRPTLIVVPTIDLMQQWASQIERFFGVKAGMLGGGVKIINELTVTTYDSALIHMEFIGNKFGMIIFDECHHLPGPTLRAAASMSIAPYRLGLTATPEREDGGEEILYTLVGPPVFEIHIDELKGEILAPYITEQIYIRLMPEEEQAYREYRQIYTDFLRKTGIDFRNRGAWQQFIIRTSTHPDGRKALAAYLKQKNIARTAKNKFRAVWKLINRHKDERIIIFTADNTTAYKIGNSFFLPVITHKTKLVERKSFLDKFRSGEYPILVTSRVLNEGVDVPEANVGIIVSGSAGIREHVQRLGRILRAQKNKQAILYELISNNTSEMNISERRRQHRAYDNQ
jgi:superfamily II DNA or RNA helicase